MADYQADYLVVGAGAIGMAVVDSLLDHSSGQILMLDRHPKPGGHWNVSYPFVTLHQPSATYGLSHESLGDQVVDEAGPNKGLYELATGAQVNAYFDGVMRHKFLPSGRVEYLAMTEYLGRTEGTHRFRIILSGEVREVTARKLIDGRKFAAQVPAITPRKWDAEGVRVMKPGELGQLTLGGAEIPGHYVIMGAGKTACDVGVWLRQMGVPARRISWVRPRESWFFNRASLQPGPEHIRRALDFPASQMRAAAEAQSGAEIFLRMEEDGHMLRIDRTAEPIKFHFPVISQGEVDLLAEIGDVIRIGRVSRVEPGKLRGAEGEAAVPENALFIDCTATAAPRGMVEPIWQGDTIVPQLLQVPLVSLSAAAIGFIEATLDNDEDRNAHAAPGRITDTVEHFPEALLTNAMNRILWSRHTGIMDWLAANRLDPGARMMRMLADASPDVQARGHALRDLTMAAVPNLQHLVAAEQERERAAA